MQQGLLIDLSRVLTSVNDAGLFVSLCSISRRPQTGSEPTVDALGQVDLTPGDYTPVTGLQNLPCMLSVWRMKPDQAAVQRLQDRFDTLAERHCLINGYFPSILQRDLATVDGITYEIMAVETDSQRILTRLAVRTYTL